MSVTFATSYLFYILFPVDSPFYLLPKLGEPQSGHFFYELVHFVSSRGGARGGAFPSSHVSVSTVILLVTWKYQSRWLVWLVPIYVGLVFATVYGRFHYSTRRFRRLGARARGRRDVQPLHDKGAPPIGSVRRL